MNISLVALVGPNGEFEYSGGGLVRFRNDDSDDVGTWFLRTVYGGIVILGKDTIRAMGNEGVRIQDLPFSVVEYDESFDTKYIAEWMDALHRRFPDARFFVGGGIETYKVFIPYCTHYHIRKAPLESPADIMLPDLFPKRGRIQ